MPLLWNYESGKLENVPDVDVTTGVASGRLSFRKGVRIPVVSPDGREGTIAAEDSGSAFQNGWRFQSAAEVAEKTRAGIEAAKAEAYDKPLTAFASGALSGATLGASDLAMRAVGADVGALREIRERSPIATTAGEIVGGIAALASPVTPAAAVAKAGMATTKAATSAIAATGKASKIVSELAGAGIGSAVEGMAYGAGTLLTEEALSDDPNLTASQVVSTVGLSGLLGAGLGVVGKGVSQTWNKWKASASNPVALMSEGYGKAAAKSFGLTGDAEKEFVHVFERGNANERAEIVHNMVNSDELYARGLSAINALEQAGKEGAAITGQIRKGAMSEVANEALPTRQVVRKEDIRLLEPSEFTVMERQKVPREVEVAYDAGDTKYGTGENFGPQTRTETIYEPVNVPRVETIYEPVTREKEWIETIKDTQAVSKISKRFESIAKKIQGSENYVKPVGNDLAQVGSDLADRIARAETKGDVFEAVHAARMQLDGLTKKLRSEQSYVAKNTMEKVTQARSLLQEHLRDADTYGHLAKTFADADEVFSRYLTARDNFKDQFMASKYVAGMGKEKVVSPGKVKGFFQRPEAEAMAFKKETISELEASVKDMREFAAKNGTDFGTDLGKISDEIAAIKRLRVSELALQHAESFTGKSLHGAVAGAAIGGLGSLISDDFGAGTTAGLTLTGMALANPRMAVKYLAKLERLQNEFGARADSALTRLLSLPRKEALPTVSASGAVRRGALMQMVQTLAPEKEAPSHDDALDSLAPYLTDPSKIDDRLVEANPHLDGVAPNTYAAMVNQTHEALKFMQSVWPQKGSRDLIFTAPGSLSTSERHAMEAYALGAFSPGVLLSQLEGGNIDPKTVEAVKAVHPALFADIQQRLIEKLPEAKNLPMRKKLAIGMAFGIPTTQGMANVGVIQQAITTHDQADMVQEQARDLTGVGNSLRPDTVRIATR